MRRTLLYTAVVGFMAAAAGCQMCAHPYDNASPTYAGPQSGPPPCGLERQGSVLNGAQGPNPSPKENAVVPSNIQEYEQKYEQPGAASPAPTQPPPDAPAVQSSSWLPRTPAPVVR
jgi:hypothetical protein